MGSFQAMYNDPAIVQQGSTFGFIFLLFPISPMGSHTGKNNRFPFLDVLGNLKNSHKNPKFGRVRQVPIRELGNSLVGTCLILPNLEFLWVCFKYPKISKNGNPLFFPVTLIVARENPRPPALSDSPDYLIILIILYKYV